ncbi:MULTISPECIES: hypothetical protein [unclassified Sphingobium]|uniref:hypothetical protein n=1 Tax=unclassified Sphingobium TaxID=2611147 RepID=UPI000D16BA7F|nr:MULTISPECIES: hypothetical protein [unclassified Sphingobium]MBG6116455.1 hypothetical protein [Sphingobium sp. JAI105]PSO12438.1 hypothetical protein C7E20_08090 [Sphingobium sp. AEW4]TWC95912.1 hypothetical protein FB595_1604 [Sphingobium sp. AEW010]TWD15116.1 hypothetical protein FB596_1614 [Sphingobium sp. AEW013]TWD19069.1 hypothetical protein FB594_1612 [Sphingobium sp. AEW001]
MKMAEEQQFGQTQLGFDLEHTPAVRSFEPDREEVRDDLRSILDSARAVTAVSLWDRRTYQYNKVVFPQMSRWLPDDERNQLCFEFFRELERIELLMAA